MLPQHPNTNYQLIFLRPFTRRRVNVCRPFLSLFRDRNPWRRFCTRREGRNVTRRTPREAVAEKERVCCDCWASSEETDRLSGVDVDVDGSREGREGVCVGWKRVGVERREEKGLEAELETEMLGVDGWVILFLRIDVWLVLWGTWFEAADSWVAHLFIGVLMLDTGVRMEGRALQRRQSIVQDASLWMGVVVLSGGAEVGWSSARGVGSRKKIKRGAADTDPPVYCVRSQLT